MLLNIHQKNDPAPNDSRATVKKMTCRELNLSHILIGLPTAKASCQALWGTQG